MTENNTINPIMTYCPRCQSPGIGFIRPNKHACHDCGFTYFHNTASAVAAIIVYQNRVLMTTRAAEPGRGQLDLPGGFVDPNESLEAALSRECKEELGIDIPEHGWQYLTSQPNVYPYDGITYHTCDTVFVAQLDTLAPIQLDTEEIMAYKLVPFTDIPQEPIAFSSLKIALAIFLEKHIANR